MPGPDILERPGVDNDVWIDNDSEADTPWVCLVYNDDINTFQMVERLLTRYCDVSLEEAKKLSDQIHHEGKAAVATGPRERIESIVVTLCSAQLSATLTKG